MSKSILCPGTEHQDIPKVLAIIDGTTLYVHCRSHGWIGLTFSNAWDKLKFDSAGMGVEVTDQKADRHFDDLQPMPLVATGRFQRMKHA
jgi:hypothetical protein